MRHDTLLRSAVIVAVLSLSLSALAVDCRSRKLTAAESLDEMTNMHRGFAQMGEVTTIKIALEENIRVLTSVRGYTKITPMAQSVELSRGALAYAENICLPITPAEHKALATMFVGVIGATENTDGAVVDRFMNRMQSTDKEKVVKKTAIIAARQAVGAAVGKAVGELTGKKIGEIVGKVVRGGPIGTAVGILLGGSDIGPGDVLTGPNATPSPTPASGSTGSDHERPSIHDGNINDAPHETTERAASTAYVAIKPTARETNNQRIADARAAIKNAKH